MSEHPLKTFISVFSGFLGGSTFLLDSAHMNPWLAFGLACIKALTIGGFAWAGQTLAIYLRKKALETWVIIKIKKKK